MSVIRPKLPDDPIRYDPSALVAAGTIPPRAVESLGSDLESARAAAVDDPVAVLPERLLAAYGTTRPESELFAILRTARRIREAVDRVVMVGCAEVVAAVRTVFEACCHPFHNELCRGERGGRPRLSFDGFGIDNDATQGLLDLVAPHGRPRSDDLLDRWALLAVGGDDAPPATRAATRLFLAELATAVGGEPRRLAALVVPVVGPADRLIDVVRVGDGGAAFEMPSGGGAFSVFSAAGLLPASIVGVDVVRLLEGAAAMNRRFREAPVASNPILQWAAVARVAATESGLTNVGLWSRSRQLDAVAAWYDLLRGRSLDRPGAGGGRGELVTSLVAEECRRDRLVVPASGPLADTGGGLRGCDATTWPDLRAAAAADDAAPRARGAATAALVLPRVDEHAVGQLLQMLMLATAVEARLAGA